MNSYILYNEKCEYIILAKDHRLSENVWTQEIQYRGINNSKFKTLPRDGLIYRDVRSFQSFPAVLYNVWIAEKDGGQNWYSINRLDLLTGKITAISTSDNFPIPKGYVDAWPSALISAQGLGDCAICLVGLKRQAVGNSFVVDYWLAELNFTDVDMQLLTLVDD